MAEPWQLLIYIALLNVMLSGLQFALEKFKDKTETQFDDRLYKVVSFLLTMLNWVMANRGRK